MWAYTLSMVQLLEFLGMDIGHIHPKHDCLKCGRSVGQMINRFRIKVEVFDGVDIAVFVLYNGELENKVIPDGEYPDDIEENLVGQGMLFKVRSNGGGMYCKDEYYEVMRICTDLEIIDMFHENDDIVTPNKAMFSPPFPKIENTNAADDHSSSLNGQVAGSSESSSSEHGIRRLRRKLLHDLGSDVEEGRRW
ncbi:uncharacterized protein LOC130729436 isoform X2 [Lotus japonicus]|uniref:uncharacterized protein LOC130729436 isoform X2 n=1 Tax=Lotus japonicus TaxID=34305 RepID=UPI00258D02D0|nr:uncharacterized protein LOC130729436 isoform X2 [Lotus japonicus]